ncbi:hypothetical protein FACS1894133_1940 [Clostridia bacterium]|nr:hypothetical protein FACS1894133_1940 [Clostridia bacterium]
MANYRNGTGASRQRQRKRRGNGRSAVGIMLLFAVCTVALLFVIKFSDIKHEFELREYPRRYASSIDKYASYYHIDANLIYAVAKTESSFRPDAESNAGARGLMQMTDETFDFVRRQLGESGETFDDLYDPDTNVKYCAYYIAYLYRTFGNVTCAIAAYHAGPGSVNTWLKDTRYSDDGDNLKLIPSATTSHYVDKVSGAYARYAELYAQG